MLGAVTVFMGLPVAVLVSRIFMLLFLLMAEKRRGFFRALPSRRRVRTRAIDVDVVRGCGGSGLGWRECGC